MIMTIYNNLQNILKVLMKIKIIYYIEMINIYSFINEEF